MKRRVALVAAVLLVATNAACSRKPPQATPDGALRLFLDDLEAAEDDPSALRRAYDLLGPAARANLTERARRAGDLQGRHIEPWEILASGPFGMAFRPKTMKPTNVGDRAIVEVSGDDPHKERASVACVAVDGAWRIEPAFPEP
jgi:hypothetical protein